MSNDIWTWIFEFRVLAKWVSSIFGKSFKNREKKHESNNIYSKRHSILDYKEYLDSFSNPPHVFGLVVYVKVVVNARSNHLALRFLNGNYRKWLKVSPHGIFSGLKSYLWKCFDPSLSSSIQRYLSIFLSATFSPSGDGRIRLIPKNFTMNFTPRVEVSFEKVGSAIRHLL